MNKDDYDISNYSDRELYVLMDLDDPSDRILEARILQLIDKYEKIENGIGNSFFNFFHDVYDHFFGDEEIYDEEIIEGYTPSTVIPVVSTEVTTPENKKPEPMATEPIGVPKLNPIKKESIKRIVSIDSQFRDRAVYPISTAFTFNLSDTLVDVVSLKLYSVQIPYTWYTISNDFGSNFFFLKGSSPGIDQGNFDYQVSIMAGNYQAQDFQSSVNASFLKNVFATNPDISFGMTGVSYNSINSKLTTTVDIKSIYNETNYNLTFASFNDYTIDSSNVLSIPQLLGFKDINPYTPCTIFSDLFIEEVPIRTYTITLNNNTIYIYLYQSQLSLSNIIAEFSNDFAYTPYPITLTLLGLQSSTDIISDLKNQIALSPFLKNRNSSLLLTDSPIGEKQFKLSLVLNRKKVENKVNLKTTVHFQEDPLYSPVWTGNASVFKFKNDYNELNNILSEIPSVVTTFPIGSTTNIQFRCTNHNYSIIEVNNKTVNFIRGVYNSVSYITSINRGFRTLARDSNNNFNCTIDINNPLTIPSIFCDINNSIPYSSNGVPNFQLNVTSSLLSTICGFPSIITNQITTSQFSLAAGGYIVDSNKNFYTVHSIGPRNIGISDKVVTIVPTVFQYLENVFDAINASFTTVLSDNVDLSRSIITYVLGADGVVTCTLNLNIIAKLTSIDYTIFLNDNENNTWNSFLKFTDASYKLTSIPINSNVASVLSSNHFFSNELMLTSKNNSFTINPVFDPSGGVYSPNNDYQITKVLTLPLNISYTKEEIVANMNLILLNDSSTQGSFVDISEPKTKIRVNVSKIFTAQDYRLVFYDKTFTHCNYGYRISIENVKWDTTLGWILGYRNLTEYPLKSKFLSNNGTTTYYGTHTDQVYTIDSTNIITLVGDTSINVNLYSYVMIILDDYCQNHLNDGLVTITKQDYDIPLPSYANRSTYKCDQTTGTVSIGNSGRVDFNNLTAKQIYSANQILNTQTIKQGQNIYSSGPYVQDIFGLVPIKTAGLQPGQSFIEFGGTLQNQERSYFGPVNISKMSIQLLNDKGSVLDLNNANWSFSFLVEMLYNPERG
jgi:hypothetical protein